MKLCFVLVATLALVCHGVPLSKVPAKFQAPQSENPQCPVLVGTVEEKRKASLDIAQAACAQDPQMMAVFQISAEDTTKCPIVTADEGTLDKFLMGVQDAFKCFLEDEAVQEFLKKQAAKAAAFVQGEPAAGDVTPKDALKTIAVSLATVDPKLAAVIKATPPDQCPCQAASDDAFKAFFGRITDASDVFYGGDGNPPLPLEDEVRATMAVVSAQATVFPSFAAACEKAMKEGTCPIVSKTQADFDIFFQDLTDAFLSLHHLIEAQKKAAAAAAGAASFIEAGALQKALVQAKSVGVEIKRAAAYKVAWAIGTLDPAVAACMVAKAGTEDCPIQVANELQLDLLHAHIMVSIDALVH